MRGKPAFVPARYPLPLTSDASDLPPASERLASFDVADDLVLPSGFRYDVLATWGDRFGPVQFGYACDYTGLVPVAGTADEFWLIVNHEYISARPWLQGAKEIHGVELVDGSGNVADRPLAGLEVDFAARSPELPDAVWVGVKRICELALTDLGVSVLRVRRRADEGFEVVRAPKDHFRIHAFGGTNIDASGMAFTGPAAHLLGRPRGTFSNCSGATTPWGTFLTCEENVQEQTHEWITPDGGPLAGSRSFKATGDNHPTALPLDFEGLGGGLDEPLDGRQYGWVVEVDPVNKTMKKHTALGRFRHENVALRVLPGKRLAAYMGDDRRGGQIWKFVSEATVRDPADPANTKLLERGILYAAKLNPDHTGSWIAIDPKTKVMRPEPVHCSSGHMWLPSRPGGGHVAVGKGKDARIAVDHWIKSIEEYSAKPLGAMTLQDLVPRGADDHLAQAVLCLDAHVMAVAAGATPTARPEDVEIHPHDGTVYIAFTDSTGSEDGSPDVRVFPDSKGDNSRQYGAIYRIIEDNDDPAATTFTWGKFVSSGEIAEEGGGFACADNLAFDPHGNLWMVCDIATPKLNAQVTRTTPADKPGGSGFVGVFGNNAMFCIPTTGPKAGQPFCFAIAPMEAELTGPTFTADGRSLLLSVQHPGEINGTRGLAGARQPTEVSRLMKLSDLKGAAFDQRRTIPVGSNFPSKQAGKVPKPCVVVVRKVLI